MQIHRLDSLLSSVVQEVLVELVARAVQKDPQELQVRAVRQEQVVLQLRPQHTLVVWWEVTREQFVIHIQQMQ